MVANGSYRATNPAMTSSVAARVVRAEPGARFVSVGAMPPRLELCVVIESVVPALPGEIERVGETLLSALREHSSRSALRALGRDEGYRIEDLTAIAVAMSNERDAHRLATWLARRVGHDVEPHAHAGAPSLAADFAGRIGGSPARARYTRDAEGRVEVEAFEVHVAEHCNLRCANCCNMSPLVADKILSLQALDAILSRVATAVRADVLKIMGGEPLLHPQIATVVRMLRASGIGKRVRLFTNGLLLARMDESFWSSLDEMTISSYASAPVKPLILELAREKSRAHDFVLNVKRVDEFTQVLSPQFERDDAAVASTFERCWLRHRCLVARNERFYMCTRAAYADDFVARAAHEPAPLDRSRDGVSLDESDLAGAIERYMNRDTPLGACRYCFGGDGAVEPHYQLTRDEVASGKLSRRLPIA